MNKYYDILWYTISPVNNKTYKMREEITELQKNGWHIQSIDTIKNIKDWDSKEKRYVDGIMYMVIAVKE